MLPTNDQPEFRSLELLAARGLLAPDTWKRAQVSLKATIDVPMLGTIIEQNGDGLLEDSYMPVGWPLHIDGAVRQCCIHRAASLQELDDMLIFNRDAHTMRVVQPFVWNHTHLKVHPNGAMIFHEQKRLAFLLPLIVEAHELLPPSHYSGSMMTIPSHCGEPPCGRMKKLYSG